MVTKGLYVYNHRIINLLTIKATHIWCASLGTNLVQMGTQRKRFRPIDFENRLLKLNFEYEEIPSW